MCEREGVRELKRVGVAFVHATASISARRPLDRAGGAQDTGKATRRGGCAAPLGQSTQGTFSGEVSAAGVVGTLGGRPTNLRPPGV
jgi:hypothetical protein